MSYHYEQSYARRVKVLEKELKAVEKDKEQNENKINNLTKKINNLMDLAIKENDHIAQEFLQWFVNEQLEEVSSMDSLLGVIRRAGENQLLLVEEYMVRRAAAAAAAQTA